MNALEQTQSLDQDKDDPSRFRLPAPAIGADFAESNCSLRVSHVMTRSSLRALTRALHMTVALTLAACQDRGELASPAAPPLSDSFVPVYRQTPSDVMERRQALTSGTGAPGITEAPGQDFYLAIERSSSRALVPRGVLEPVPPQGEASGAARPGHARGVVPGAERQAVRVRRGPRRPRSSTPSSCSRRIRSWRGTAVRATAGLEGLRPVRSGGRSQPLRRAAGCGGPARGGPVVLAGLPHDRRDGVTFEQVFSGTARRHRVGRGARPVRARSRCRSAATRRARATPRWRSGALALLPQRHPKHRRRGRHRFEAARWNIKPGGRPSLEDRPAGRERASTRLRRRRLLGAIKRGIENWNEAFGFKAFEARLAEPTIVRRRRQELLSSTTRAAGLAFADWRTNPNTGEIRGASVWMGRWLFAIMDSLLAGEAAPLCAAANRRRSRTRCQGAVPPAVRRAWPGGPPATNRCATSAA